MSFVPITVNDYEGKITEGANGWCASLYYGEILALQFPQRRSAEKAMKDCEAYAKNFGWNITWRNDDYKKND